MTQEHVNYVKIVSKKDEYFLDGIEVFDYEHPRRISYKDFCGWLDGANTGILVRGLREKDEEYFIDGELSSLQEFTFEFVEHDGSDIYKNNETMVDMMNGVIDMEDMSKEEVLANILGLDL